MDQFKAIRIILIIRIIPACFTILETKNVLLWFIQVLFRSVMLNTVLDNFISKIYLTCFWTERNLTHLYIIFVLNTLCTVLHSSFSLRRFMCYVVWTYGAALMSFSWCPWCLALCQSIQWEEVTPVHLK